MILNGVVLIFEKRFMVYLGLDVLRLPGPHGHKVDYSITLPEKIYDVCITIIYITMITGCR